MLALLVISRGGCARSDAHPHARDEGDLMATYRVRVLIEEIYFIEAASITDALSDWRGEQAPEQSVVTDIHARAVRAGERQTS
jgi:hypothetical protein